MPSPMWRFERGQFIPEDFPLPEERELLLVVNGRPWVRLACSPGGDLPLALGHLYFAGALRDLAGVRYRVGDGFVALDLPGQVPEPGVGVRDTGCGAEIRRGELPLRPLPRVELDPELPIRLLAALREGALGYRRTRGIHGAALFDLQGQLLYLNEDVGRHNAVDRVMGQMLLEGIRPPVALAVTGRVSREMAAKAIAMGAVLLASRTGALAPAVELSHQYGLALAAYVRPTGYRLYAPGGMPVTRKEGVPAT